MEGWDLRQEKNSMNKKHNIRKTEGVLLRILRKY